MRRPGWCGSVALCLAAVILAASAASARTERFRWTQPSTSPVVSLFWLYWGPSSGSYPNHLSVGIPAKDSTGAYYYDIVVPDADTIYATVTAWSGTLESPKSNEISRAGITSGGGTTTPPPPTSGTKPIAPIVTVSGSLVHVQPATTGTAATGGWITLYPFNSAGSPVTLTDPVSGGAFPRDLDLTPYFTEALSAVRIEVEGCASNSYGFTCSAHLNVPRTATPPSSSTLGTPGQPYVLP
jgi:hypothetical protein